MKKRILFLIPILAVLLSVNNVFAEEISNATIHGNGNINGVTIYNSLTNFNSYAISTAGEALAFNNNISIGVPTDADAKNLLGQPLLVTLNLCTMENWQGVTDANNVTGNFSYARNYATISTGSCKIRGTNYTGNGYTMYMVVTPVNYTIDAESTYRVITGSITFWGGGFAQGGGYFSSNGFSVELFTKETETAFQQIVQNNTVISQNQTIINQNQATNDKLDDMLNADADASVNPDDSKYDDYESAENSLKDKVNHADLSNLSIGIDSNSSRWVWETLTSLLQSHSAIFGMVIAILSIGIIKLALGR
ncbi:MAG: hypothetical protein E7167_04015 [Firmicutes bacterium]|nr:hypothetical protein [Bacillota bacterium]